MKFHESSSERGNVIFTIDMPLMGPKWLVIQISDNSDKIPKSYGSICIESEAKISIWRPLADHSIGGLFMEISGFSEFWKLLQSFFDGPQLIKTQKTNFPWLFQGVGRLPNQVVVFYWYQRESKKRKISLFQFKTQNLLVLCFLKEK